MRGLQRETWWQASAFSLLACRLHALEAWVPESLLRPCMAWCTHTHAGPGAASTGARCSLRTAPSQLSQCLQGQPHMERPHWLRQGQQGPHSRGRLQHQGLAAAGGGAEGAGPAGVRALLRSSP